MTSLTLRELPRAKRAIFDKWCEQEGMQLLVQHLEAKASFHAAEAGRHLVLSDELHRSESSSEENAAQARFARLVLKLLAELTPQDAKIYEDVATTKLEVMKV